MSELTFNVPQKPFADALHNAVVLSKEAPSIPTCPHVLIVHQGSPEGRGIVAVYGAGRHAGGRTVVTLDSAPPADAYAVAITREDADRLQSALRGGYISKTALLAVTISEEGIEVMDEDEDGNPDVGFANLIVYKGEELVADLLDSDPEEKWSWAFDQIDGLIASAGPQQTCLTLSLTVIKRLVELKGADSTVLDMAPTSHERVVAFALGSTVRGIIGDVDREVYRRGTPGSAGHLLNP